MNNARSRVAMRMPRPSEDTSAIAGSSCRPALTMISSISTLVVGSR